MTFLKKWFYFLILFTSTSVFAQEGQIDKEETNNSRFDGFYMGANLGLQNIFGGAFINDLDLLTQRSRFVFEFSPGYRFQFSKNRFVVGLEAQFGFTDGDMEGYDNRLKFDVFYKNSTQFGFGLILGVTVGSNKNFLIYAYANETKRNFDINFTDSDGNVYKQEDGQAFLRYGIGLETPVINNFNFRAFFGGVIVDYGDLHTSQDVDDKFDFNLGIIYQF